MMPPEKMAELSEEMAEVLRRAVYDPGSAMLLTVDDVLAAHAQFGQLNRASVKAAMGANWPAHWDDIPEGKGIFEPANDQPTVTS